MLPKIKNIYYQDRIYKDQNSYDEELTWFY